VPLTTSGKNSLLTDGLDTFTHIALLDDTQTEIAGGSPAYARKAVTWTAAASGVRDNNADLVFDVQGGDTAAYWAAYDASSAGNQKAYGQIGSTIRGVATMQSGDDIFRSDAHGLANDHRVFVAAVAGEALPTGVSAATLYFVVNVATDTFQLATTSGGSAINLTTDGEIAFFRTVPEVFGSQGTLTIATGNLDIDANFV
jgi:hypothetical protein